MSRTLSRRLLLAGAGGTAAALAAPRAWAQPRRPDRTLLRWASDTWRSMDALADAHTGLPADNIGGDLTGAGRYTSPTNIGGYLWSALIARELRIITPGECRQRIARTLQTLGTMKRHDPSGMYFNWYDPRTGRLITTWPDSGEPVTPFVSSVDAAWLGAALKVVAAADPSNRHAARRLYDAMRWDMFFDPAFNVAGGNHGGFYLVQPPGNTDGFWGNHLGTGPDVWYTNHHYDTAISETRITTYLGIIEGQIPASGYFGTWRTFPDDWTWQEMIPTGTTHRYLGVDVYEGSYRYRGRHVVPGWGGSMFEELMPDLFVPEAEWGPRSWGRNHPGHVRAQREHGLDEAKYGYWGFSPCSNPAGGYREYGVDALGMNPAGYFSDQEQTDYSETTNPHPTYGDGVVTPHAGFLAMMHEPDEARDNLSRIERTLHCYGEGGFFDAVATRSQTVARRYLALDQAMILGAIGNIALHDRLKRWFATADTERALRPVLAREEFGTQ